MLKRRIVSGKVRRLIVGAGKESQMTGLPSFNAGSLALNSPGVRAAYEASGVVILKGFASADECAAL